MDQEQLQPSDEYTKEQLKRLLSELHDFRQTSLYKVYCQHFDNLYRVTVDQIIEEPLKGPETLYMREAWIGEARAAKVNLTWFDILNIELTDAERKLN